MPPSGPLCLTSTSPARLTALLPPARPRPAPRHSYQSVFGSCHPSAAAPDRLAYYQALKEEAPKALPAPEARALASAASGPAATTGLGSRRRQAAAQPGDYAKMLAGGYERAGPSEPERQAPPPLPKPKRRPGRPAKAKPEYAAAQPPEAQRWGAARQWALKREGSGPGASSGSAGLQYSGGGSSEQLGQLGAPGAGQAMEVESAAAGEQGAAGGQQAAWAQQQQQQQQQAWAQQQPVHRPVHGLHGAPVAGMKVEQSGVQQHVQGQYHQQPPQQEQEQEQQQGYGGPPVAASEAQWQQS